MRRSAFDDALEEARVYFKQPRITKTELRSKKQSRGIVRIRWFMMAYMRARDPMHYTFPVIARSFNRDHTTAIHGVYKAHDIWGELLFRKLTLEAVGSIRRETPHAVHIRVSETKIFHVGMRNLERAVSDMRRAA